MPKKYTRYSKNICITIVLFLRKYRERKRDFELILFLINIKIHLKSI